MVGILSQAWASLDTLYGALRNTGVVTTDGEDADPGVVARLEDDLDTPGAMAELHRLAGEANRGDIISARRLIASMRLMGFMLDDPVDVEGWFHGKGVLNEDEMNAIDKMVSARSEARLAKDWSRADQIRDLLNPLGVSVEDRPDGGRWTWRPNLEGVK